MSNCFIYALKMFFRRGGYILVRKSRYGWWPHFLWTEDFSAIYEYAPAAKHDKLFPPLLFRGTVKRRSADELP